MSSIRVSSDANPAPPRSETPVPRELGGRRHEAALNVLRRLL